MITCCKNCNYLIYYDGYYCGEDTVQNIQNKEDLQIDDIENSKCELFSKREGKFWINGEF